MSSYLAHKRKGFQGSAPAAFNGFGNRSRSFDGVDDKVTIAVDPVDDEPITISAWVKLDTTTQVGGIFNIEGDEAGSGNEGFGLLVVNGEFWAYSQEVGIFDKAVSTSTLNTTEWWHVCGVFRSPTDREIYINGTSEGTNTTSVNPSTTIIDNACIGNRANTNNDQDFSGKIADVRIYDTDLTASQISDLYAGTNITTNLVGHWLTDADNLLDAAGTNHGTNYGSKYSYDNPSPPVEFGSASRFFDGVDDYVSLPSGAYQAFSSGDDFTVACWCKPSVSISSSSMVIGFVGNSVFSRPQINLFCKSDGSLSVSVRQQADSNTNNVSTSGTDYRGGWHHVAMTYRGSDSRVELFIDGSSVGTDTTHSLTFATSDFDEGNIGALGATGAAYDGFFNGLVADVRTYNAILGDSNIADLYNGTNITTNLVGHWLTNNDDVEDKAGTNDGTNFGSTYSYDNPPMDLVPSRQASRDFDGVSDYIDLGDSDDFSFGDGSNDSPFSISAWIKPNAGSFRILTKYNNDTNTREYTFTIDSSNRLIALLYDQSNSNTIVRRCSSNLMSNYFGQWVHVVMTYDGSSTHAGLKCFINKVREDDLSTGSGSYVSMENTNESAKIGVNGSTAYSNGKKADVRLYNSELSTTDILNIYNGTTDRTNLIGQWLTNSDDVIDHAGTNDGTNFGSTYSTDSPS